MGPRPPIPDEGPYRQPRDLSGIIPPDRRRLKAVVLIGVGVIIGALSVGFARCGRGAKILHAGAASEARRTLKAIARNAATAYEGERLGKIRLDPNGPPPSIHNLCESATQPVPADRNLVSGKAYASTDADWLVDRSNVPMERPDVGFACLRWKLTEPQRFQYDYKATHASFVVRAHGDLDGDGVFSTFELRGDVVNGRVVIADTIDEIDPDE